ncbi:hypothetical protein [Kangiella sp.]|uniref:hypothetical protein n=1 Tax=Kangiella sp. TaxID=1920245 RepID=UPI003A93F537
MCSAPINCDPINGDLGHGFRGQTIGYSIDDAWEIHGLTRRLTLNLEDMCVLIASETHKANAIRYHFHRSTADEVRAILKQMDFNNKEKHTKVCKEMKTLVWTALKVKIPFWE